MSKSTLRIRCGDCGSDTFVHSNDPKPDDVVTCKGCGRTSKYADLQAAAMDAAKKLVGKVLPGIKWK